MKNTTMSLRAPKGRSIYESIAFVKRKIKERISTLIKQERLVEQNKAGLTGSIYSLSSNKSIFNKRVAINLRFSVEPASQRAHACLGKAVVGSR